MSFLKAIGVYASRSAEAVYKFGHARESVHAKSLGNSVTVSVYDFDKHGGKHAASATPPLPPLYSFVVVAEERQHNRYGEVKNDNFKP